MARIPDHILDDIRARLPLEQLIGEYLPLKRRGKNFIGLCPFHNEKSPSFTVHPAKAIYKCYGCGRGGNAFTFLMEKEGLTFPEAIEELAQRVGVDLPKDDFTPKQRQTVEDKQLAWTLMAECAQYYQRQLRESGGEVAREYLKGRGLSGETAKHFQLGYAPNTWDGVVETIGQRNGKRLKVLEELGMVRQRASGGGYYDFFRHKIMFPIWDVQGRVVAFGGRQLPSDDPDAKPDGPKYINSPETRLYQKNRILYGLHLAKDVIRETDQALIVEGYMDVIGATQAGVTNAVATCGTALTEGHVGMIKRFTDRIAFVYDGDSAGRKAMLRSLPVMLPHDVEVRCLALPDGHDPDSYLQEHPRESFDELLGKAPDSLAYAISCEREDLDLRSPHDQQRFLQAMAEYASAIKSPVLKDALLRRLTDATGQTYETVRGEMDRHTRKQFQIRDPDAIQAPKRSVSLSEPVHLQQARVLYILTRKPENLIEAAEKLLPEDFTVPEYRQLAVLLFELGGTTDSLDESRVYDACMQEGLLDVMLGTETAMAQARDESDLHVGSELEASILRLKELNLKAEIRRLQGKIREAMAEGQVDVARNIIEERRAVQECLRTLGSANAGSSEATPF